MTISRPTATSALIAALLGFGGAAGALAGSPPPSSAGASGGRAPFPTACPPGTLLHSGSIATIAGTGVAGDSGDGGPAIVAMIDPSFGTLGFDASGAVYFADSDHASVRRIDTDGTITTFAGPSTGAPFVTPAGVAIDHAGKVYVADIGVGRIWRVDPSGAIASIAGTGVLGSDGDDGPATNAAIQPSGIAIGPRGDLYFDDLNRYRTIDPSGVIHAFAGTGIPGFSGDGGPATQATFSTEVVGVAADAAGNVYLGDRANHRVRKVDPQGIITTVAGSGQEGYSGDGGPALQAALGTPHGVAVDESGDLFLTDDYDSSTVRKVDPDGTITTLAGGTTSGFSGDCGPAAEAKLDGPVQVAVHDGVVFIPDNTRIRIVVP
jgi:hypothetical protein